MPWNDPKVAEDLHRGWTLDARNVDDAKRLAGTALTEAPVPTSVLDYGCGTGRMAAYFDPLTYTGFDLSDHMLAVARREYPRATFTNLLPPDQRFSLVLCNSVVQYQPDDVWNDVVRDIAIRATRVALIETYDGPARETTGGYNVPVFIRPSSDYMAALSPFAHVERRVLVDDPTSARVLYVVRSYRKLHDDAA